MLDKLKRLRLNLSESIATNKLKVFLWLAILLGFFTSFFYDVQFRHFIHHFFDFIWTLTQASVILCLPFILIFILGALSLGPLDEGPPKKAIKVIFLRSVIIGLIAVISVHLFFAKYVVYEQLGIIPVDIQIFGFVFLMCFLHVWLLMIAPLSLPMLAGLIVGSLVVCVYVLGISCLKWMGIISEKTAYKVIPSGFDGKITVFCGAVVLLVFSFSYLAEDDWYTSLEGTYSKVAGSDVANNVVALSKQVGGRVSVTLTPQCRTEKTAEEKKNFERALQTLQKLSKRPEGGG